MNADSIAISALATGRRALDLIGQNISNAATPGYSRQAPNLVNKTIDGVTGVGVDVATITRYTSAPLRSAILRANADESGTTARLDYRRQAETALQPGTGGVDGRLEEFFNQIERMTTRPEDVSQRRPAVAAAADLAQRFNQAARDLDNVRNDAGRQIGQTVDEVNALATRIADLNARIAKVETIGGEANDLRDERDRAIDDLSKRIDVRTVEQPFGVVNVLGTTSAVVVGDQAVQFRATKDAQDQFVIARADQPNRPLRFEGGKLGGLLQAHNEDFPASRSRLDSLAAGLIRNFDQTQATGLGGGAPFTTLTGTRAVPNPAAPLASLNLPFPPQAGNLVIAVTNQGTSQRTNVAVAIDPATQSLNDVAAAITAATSGQVQASVDPGSNNLVFQAQAGFAFDFAGRLPTNPPTVNINGSAVPKVTGTYQGSANDTYSFQVVGNGTVGVTSGLTLEVRNGANQLLTTLNIGDGYTPDTPLPVGNGLKVQLSSGTSNAGNFATPVISNPDQPALLSALGVNSLFAGNSAVSIAVRPEILADPSRLSVSRTGESGDSANLQRFAALRDQPLLGGGTRTFAQEYTDIATAVGADVKALNERQSAQAGALQNLFGQEQAVGGVDVNEELVHLLQFQRMVESASRYLSVVNRAVDSILEIAR